jgi:AraC-like DNA-binding protein
MKGQSFATKLERLDNTLFTLLSGEHTFANHTHDTYSLGVMLRGYSSFTRERKTDLLHEGKIFFANPQEVHTCQCGKKSKEWVYANIYPSVSFMQQLSAQLDLNIATTPMFPQICSYESTISKQLQNLFYKIIHKQELLDLESELIETLSRLIVANANNSAKKLLSFEQYRPKEITRVLEYLNSVNDLGGVRVNELAAVAGFSPYHFIRTFQKTVGMTPYAYASQLRVTRAQKMLLNGETPAMAAALSGFSDQSHMTRAFKKVYGVTPAKFTKNKRG